MFGVWGTPYMHAPSVLVGSHACSSCSALDMWLVSPRLSLLSILQMKCTDVHAVTSKQLYRLLHYTVQTAAWPCKWPVYKWPVSAVSSCSALVVDVVS